MSIINNKIFLKFFLLFIVVTIFQFMLVSAFILPHFKATYSQQIKNQGLTVLENIYDVIDSSYEEYKLLLKVTEDTKKETLKNIVQTVHSTIKANYNLYKNGKISQQEAKKRSLETISAMRYNKDDYIFITSKDVVTLAHPKKSLINKSAKNLKDADGKSIVTPMVQKALANKEGFHTYYWSKSNDKKKQKKITYFKLFEEWGWIIGTGIYLNDVEKITKQFKVQIDTKIQRLVESTKIGKSGYFYIFDKNHHMLYHPNKYVIGETFKSIPNPNTSYTMAQSLQKAAHSDSKTLYYLWDKPDDKKNYIYKKVSWMKQYEPLGWYIGSSSYLDELNQPIVDYTYQFILLNITILIALSVIVYGLLEHILNPAKKIIISAKAVQNGDYSIKTNLTQDDEIGLLGKTFDTMIDKLKQREEEQKLQQEQINNLNQELQQKVEKQLKDIRVKEQLLIQQSRLATLGEMIGNIAHHWRQPLNALSITKDVLIEDYYDNSLSNAQVEEFEIKMNDTIQYMSHTIDDFRNFFRPSKEMSIFDVVKSVDDITIIVQAQLKNHHIELNINNNSHQKIEILGYENEFKQVVINLVNNAKDVIMQKDIQDGKIDIAISKDEEYAYIDVSDNGGGISEDIIDKIFDPYFTTKFESQGTGLGLYMSKTIIQNNMKGTLIADNSDDGAIFSIKLKMNSTTKKA